MEINYSIRTVHFYSDLHKFLTQKELSYEQIGTNTNSCIKIKQLTNRCRNPHQVVQYHATNSTDHCSDSHSELLGHYLPLNIDRRENRMKQKVKKLWDVAFSQKDQPDIAKTKHGRQYAKEVRKMYYSMLSQNIPPNKIRGIIKSVFQHLLPTAKLALMSYSFLVNQQQGTSL